MAVTGAHRHASSVFVVPTPNLGGTAAQAVVAVTSDLQAKSHMGSLQDADLNSAAESLMLLAGEQGHPLLQAALLARAGRLAIRNDAGRGRALLRESFRLFPDEAVGSRLRDAASDDESWLRLGRLGHLVESVVALADSYENKIEHLLVAAQTQIGLGHGRAALRSTDQLLALQPGHEQAQTLAAIAQTQIDERAVTLQEQRAALVSLPEGERLEALLSYAELLVMGDEPLSDAVAVLADALDAGAPAEQIAPLWVELARAMGNVDEQVRALSVAVTAGEALPNYLAFADELANLPEVDRRYPLAAAKALAALAFAIPDDPQLRARLEVCEHLLEPETAELRLDAMRVRCLRDRDKAGECQACLTLAWLAAQHGDQEGAERHYRRVRSLMPTHPEALDFFERAYRESGDWKRLQVALVQRQSAAEGRELVHVTAELARINEGPLAAPDRATEAWERVLSLQPDHQEAAAALARLYEAQGRWAGLRDVLEATARMAQARVAIESAARQRAIAAWERMGTLHETPGQLPSRHAALQAWQAVQALSPTHPVALDRIRTALLAIGNQATWADVLTQAVTAAALPGSTVPAADRLAWLVELGDVSFDLGRSAAAQSAYATALSLAPEQADLLPKLAKLARATGDQGGLRKSLRDSWQSWLQDNHLDQLPAETRSARAEVFAEAANLAESAGDTTEARTLWKALADLLPGSPDAVSGVIRNWTETRSGLRDWLQTQADTAPIGGRRLGVLVAWVQVAEADGAWEEVSAAAARWLALEPGAAAAQLAMARALLQEGRIQDVRKALSSDQDGAAQAVSLLLESATSLVRPGAFVARQQRRMAAAQLLAAELGDSESAVGVLADLLADADFGTQIADRRRAVAEAVLGFADTAVDKDAVAEAAVTAAEVAAEAVTGPAGRAFRCTQARWLQQLGRWSESWVAATTALEDALSSGGDDAGTSSDVAAAWALVAEGAPKAEQQADVADQVASWAELLGDSALSTAMWQTLIDWSEVVVLAPDLTERAWLALSSRQPGDRAVALHAAQLAARRGDWTKAATVLAEASALQPDDAELTDQWLQAERQRVSAGGETSVLIAALQEALRRTPAAQLWTELADLQGAEGAHAAAAQAWLAALELDASTPAEPVLAAMAQLADAGDADGAKLVGDQLWPIVDARQDLGLMDALLQLRLQAAVTDSAKIPLWKQLVDLRGHALGDLQGAFDAAASWLVACPNDADAVATLAQTVASAGDAISGTDVVQTWLAALAAAGPDLQAVLRRHALAALEALPKNDQTNAQRMVLAQSALRQTPAAWLDLADTADAAAQLALQAAQAWLASGDQTAAIALLTVLVAARPSDATAAATLDNALLAAAQADAAAWPALVSFRQAAWAQATAHGEASIERGDRWLEALSGAAAAGSVVGAGTAVGAGNVWQAWQDISAAASVAQTDHWTEVLARLLADMVPTDLTAPGLAAWQVLIARHQAAGAGAAEAAARREVLERFGDSIDVAAERRALAQCLGDRAGEPLAALAEWQGLLAVGWTDDAATAAMALADATGGAADLDEFLQAVAESTESPATRASQQMQLANRAAARGDSDKALRLLDAVLLDDPGHTEAFALRGDLLHLTEPDPQAWIAHWAHGRDHATNPQERGAAILALARAWLQLENGDQAWPVLVDLLSAPSTPDEDWLQAAEVATATAALLGDRASLAALWCDVAADRPDRLAAVFGLAADADWPAEDLAQVAEAAAAESAVAWAWLRSWSRHAESAHTHAQRLLDRAAALAARGQTAESEAAWQDALVFAAQEHLPELASQSLAGLRLALTDVEHWPLATATVVLEAALAVARSQGADTAVATLTSRLAEQATGKRAADLWHQNAEVLLALGQATDALDALDMALVCDDSGAGLQQLRAEVLLSLGRAEEAWVCLRVAGSPLRAAELAWQAGNLEAAVEALTDALSADPASEALWHAVEQLGADPTALAAMIQHLNPLWQMAGQQGRAVALWRLQIDHLTGEDRQKAQRDLATVLRNTGAEAEAYSLWLTVATGATPGKADDDLLANVLDALVQAEEAAAAAALTERWQQDTLAAARSGVWPAAVTRAVAGHLAEQAEAAGQPDVAAAAWEAAWRADPTDADARDVVLSWCRRLGDLGHWSDLLGEALQHAQADAAPALLLERADVLRQLQQPQDALQCLTQVAESSSLAVSQATELVSALEHLARQPETADGALVLLERLLGEQQDSESQVRLLRLRLDRATSTEERTRIALALAQVQSGGQAAGGAAVSTLLGILESSPSVATLAALEALARPGIDDAAVARALELVSAAALPTVDLHAVAQHGVDFAARRGDAAGQEHWLRRALSLDRNDSASQEDLESLLDVQGRLDELVDMLHTRLQAELAQSPLPSDARRLSLHRLATLAATLNRAPVALWAWRAVSAMDPAEPDGPTGEVELLRELDDMPGLVQALQRLAAVTTDLGQRAEHWTEAARLTAKILKKEEEAADLYKAALQANGRLDEPFVWLEKHFAGQPAALAELYERRAAAVEPGPTRILVLRKQAHALLDLGDGLGACTVLDTALKDDPTNGAVLDELQRLSEQAGAWAIHTSVLRMRLERETRREPRVALLGQLARVLLGELRDAEAGEPIVDALRDLAPREPVTRHALAMLQAASGEPREAAAGLEQILKESQDIATQIALHQQLADLYVGPLDSPARAIRELQKLIAIEPKRWSARRRLCDLYAARESWEALVESLRQWLVVVTGERDKARGTLSLETGRMLTTLHVELGQSLGKLKRWPEAVAELRRAVALGGQSTDAAATLATALVEVGEIAEAQEQLSWLVENLQQDGAGPALADAATQLGQLYLKQGELGASRDAFRKALQAQPDHMLATLGSGQMLLALGDTDRALRLFDAVLKFSDVPADRQADAQEGLGRCRLAKGQKEQARTAFQAALRLVPGHKGAREGMLEV